MLRRFSSREVLRALAKIDILPVRQRGSHIRLRGFFRGGPKYVTVPANEREIDEGTFRSILKQAGLTQEELENLLDN
jgi:predicted RNA binding protein YcfA (HicA-like mRNA interferase family)